MDFYEIRGPTHQSQIHKSFYADGVPPPFHRGVRYPLSNTWILQDGAVIHFHLQPFDQVSNGVSNWSSCCCSEPEWFGGRFTVISSHTFGRSFYSTRSTNTLVGGSQMSVYVIKILNTIYYKQQINYDIIYILQVTIYI